MFNTRKDMLLILKTCGTLWLKKYLIETLKSTPTLWQKPIILFKVTQAHITVISGQRFTVQISFKNLNRKDY